jgi:hypothetical protein
MTGPKKQIADGPFVEAKDIISGYPLTQAKDEAQQRALERNSRVQCGLLDSASHFHRRTTPDTIPGRYAPAGVVLLSQQMDELA